MFPHAFANLRCYQQLLYPWCSTALSDSALLYSYYSLYFYNV